jgi:hypothetical protein
MFHMKQTANGVAKVAASRFVRSGDQANHPRRTVAVNQTQTPQPIRHHSHNRKPAKYHVHRRTPQIPPIHRQKRISRHSRPHSRNTPITPSTPSSAHNSNSKSRSDNGPHRSITSSPYRKIQREKHAEISAANPRGGNTVRMTPSQQAKRRFQPIRRHRNREA